MSERHVIFRGVSATLKGTTDLAFVVEQKASTLDGIAEGETLNRAIATEARSTAILPTEPAIVEFVKQSCSLHNEQQAMRILIPLEGSSGKAFLGAVCKQRE